MAMGGRDKLQDVGCVIFLLYSICIAAMPKVRDSWPMSRLSHDSDATGKTDI